jgi:uncharacterized protein (DUF362 family)
MRRREADLERRALLKQGVMAGAALGLGPLAMNLAGCGGGKGGEVAETVADAGADAATEAVSDTVPGPVTGSAVLLGLYPRASLPSPLEAMERSLERLDFSWLAPNDSVLVKVASNSANPHPAVTSPDAVAALVVSLKQRGAGRVMVADQAGIQQVRLTADGQRFGSTREVMQANGLLAAIAESGGEALFFDELDFHAGFFAATPPPASAWGEAVYLPNEIKQVDHIVYLPRLSSHLIAGHSLGYKAAIGWLREDDRFRLHNDGAGLYERWVDVHHVDEIRSRFRLALTLVDGALLDMGPDQGTLHQVDPRAVIASADLAAHDALALGLLLHLDATVPRADTVKTPYQSSTANLYNQLLVGGAIAQSTGLEWGAPGTGEYRKLAPPAFEQGLAQDRVLARAWALTGGKPQSLRVVVDGATVDPALAAALAAWGGGMFKLEVAA